MPSGRCAHSTRTRPRRRSPRPSSRPQRVTACSRSSSPARSSDSTRLGPDAPDAREVGVDLSTDRIVTFEFEPPGEDRPYLAAAYPIRLGGDKGVTFSYPDRGQAEGGAAGDLDHPAHAARDRVPRRPRHRRRARALPLAPDHEAGAGALEGDGPGRRGTPRRGRAPGSRRRRDRPPHRALPGDDDPARRGGRARAELPDVGLARAADAADRDSRARRRAARGCRHRPGGGRGVARDHRRGGGAARTSRRRRARSRQARRAPVHRPHRGGRHGPAPRAGVLDLQRGGAEPGDRVHAGARRSPGDRLGRRPRAPDHLEPPLERLPLDAGRRADRPRAVERQRHGDGRHRRHRAGNRTARSASGSSGRSGRSTDAGPGSGFRSRASSRWRSAAGSSWRAKWGRGAGSGSSCRSGGCASRRLGARRTGPGRLRRARRWRARPARAGR